MIECSLCKKKFDHNCLCDATKHLTEHTGIYCELNYYSNTKQGEMKYS